MTPSSVSFEYGSHKVTLETGKVARQASGAVIATMGDTVVEVSECHQADIRYFPSLVSMTVRDVAKASFLGEAFENPRVPRWVESTSVSCFHISMFRAFVLN